MSSWPGDLAVVGEFVNSREIDRDTDGWATPEMLGAWLVDHGLLDEAAGIGPDERSRADAVREALRTLALSNNAADVDAERATAIVNGASTEIGFNVVFSDRGAELEPSASGFAGALGRILAIVARAMTTGTWDRFKTCANDECQWVFYDNARNHSRRWCSMEVCGNRVKARSYRERRSHTAP